MWVDIEGYEARYQVNEEGLVRSLAHKSVVRTKMLKQNLSSSGYLTVCLYKNDGGKTKRVNRLVAAAFHPNPEGKPFVDHINRRKTDNRSENLRWVTHLENMDNVGRMTFTRCPTCQHKCVPVV